MRVKGKRISSWEEFESAIEEVSEVWVDLGWIEVKVTKSSIMSSENMARRTSSLSRLLDKYGCREVRLYDTLKITQHTN